MLKLIGFIISVFLIVIIFLRMPQENVGLASFATKVTYWVLPVQRNVL
jgi:hypothetical protein